MREIDKSVERWVFGYCFPMAIALHQHTGWSIGAMTADRGNGRGSQMAHNWVVDPDGGWWDAAGRLTKADLEEAFLSTETDECRASARYDVFPDIESYNLHIEQVEGGWASQAFKWLKQMAPSAEEAALNLVIPRHPELQDAVERSFTEPGYLALQL